MEIRHGTVRQVRTGPGAKGPLVQVLHEAIPVRVLPLGLVESTGLSDVLNPLQAGQEHVGISRSPSMTPWQSYYGNDALWYASSGYHQHPVVIPVSTGVAACGQ